MSVDLGKPLVYSVAAKQSSAVNDPRFEYRLYIAGDLWAAHWQREWPRVWETSREALNAFCATPQSVSLAFQCSADIDAWYRKVVIQQPYVKVVSGEDREFLGELIQRLQEPQLLIELKLFEEVTT